MLSQKFKATILLLLDDKEKGKQYDAIQTDRSKMYEMGYSYSIMNMELRDIARKLAGNDQNTYNNYICNGILNNDVFNNGRKVIHDFYITQLQYLDYMGKDSQNIINECLNALNIDYVIDDTIYEKIKIKLIDTMWEYILIKIHFYKMMQKIYFVWKIDKLLYMPDIMKYMDLVKKVNSNINVCPIDPYITFAHVITYVCNPGTNHDDIYNLLQFVESLIVKYAPINIFEMIDTSISQKKFVKVIPFDKSVISNDTPIVIKPVKKNVEHIRLKKPISNDIPIVIKPVKKNAEHIPLKKPLSKSIYKKKAIPKILKDLVWKTYIGEKYSCLCLICNNEKISAPSFDCAHVEAEVNGGDTILENLRPICKSCNNSMSTMNMKDFCMKYFPKAKILTTFPLVQK